MQDEKLSERASEAAQKATAILKILEGFGSKFEERLHNVLRQSAVQEVEQVFRSVMQEVEEGKRKIDESLLLDRDKEVWVYAAPSEYRSEYILSTDQMQQAFAQQTAEAMQAKGRIYLQVEPFSKLVHDLGKQILAGKLDQHIHLTAKHLIYNKMREHSPD